jgi:Subtilase family
MMKLASLSLFTLGVMSISMQTAVSEETGKSTQELVLQLNKLTSKVVSEVAALGIERNVVAPAGSDVLKLIAKYCGSSNAGGYYLAVFIAANESNKDIADGKTVLTLPASLKLPACLYADVKPSTIPVDDSGKLLLDDAQFVSSRAFREFTGSNAVVGDDVTVVSGGVTNKQWNTARHASELGVNEHSPRAPGQSVDYVMLNQAVRSALPTGLKNLGPTLATTVDSARLTADPYLSGVYKSLVKSAVADPEKTTNGDDPSTQTWSSALTTGLRTQGIIAANADVQGTSFPPNSSILSFGFVPGSYSVALKPGLNLETIKTTLASLPTDAGVNAASVVNNYQRTLPASDQRGDPSCQVKSPESWPIDVQELKTVLTLRKSVRPQKKPEIASVVVFDSGFPEDQVSTPPFKTDFFVKKSGDVLDSDNQQYLWTLIGPPDKFYYYYDKKRDANHGVGVLTLALGGVEIVSKDLLAADVAVDKDWVVSLTGYRLQPDGSLAADANAVIQTLGGENANWGQTVVAAVNMSLDYNVAINTVLGPQVSGIEKKNYLYVFSAGNDGAGNSVGGEITATTFPAAWGGDRNPNVITVGGVDQTGIYWKGSDWSVHFVDIAAPGCSVPTYEWKNNQFEPVSVTGTSFAAPLVSFAANLLHDLGDAKRTKARILSSGRYNGNLLDKVWSSRMLDVATAVATPFDALRDGAGKLRLGHIQWPAGGVGFCGLQQKKIRVGQIHLVDAKTGVVNWVNRGDTPDVISFTQCRLDQGELSDIIFQEIKQSDQTKNGIQLGDEEHIDIRNITSITMCELCLYN